MTFHSPDATREEVEAFLREHPDWDYEALEREALAVPEVRAAYERARAMDDSRIDHHKAT